MSRPRLFRFILGLSLAVAIAIGGWLWLRHSTKALLDAARRELAEVPRSELAVLREQHAHRAVELTGTYLARSGPESASAQLLMAAAQTVRGSGTGWGNTLSEASLRQCATSDLCLAAQLAFGAGDLSAADRIVAEALQRTDERANVLRVSGLVRYELGRDDETLAACRELIGLLPDDPAPWMVIALVFEKQGKLNQVIEPLKKYIELSHGSADRHRAQLVEYLARVHLVSEARAEFDRLRADHPELVVPPSLTEARLLQPEGRDAEALKITAAYLRQHPGDLAALNLRGQLLLSRGENQSAAEVFRKIVERTPNDHEAHYQLGQAYARLGERENADQHFRVQQRLVRAKTEIHRLQRRASREPSNVAVREEIAKLSDEVGWADTASFWRRSAEIAARTAP
jgi:Flp pilus assembly protein TadD